MLELKNINVSFHDRPVLQDFTCSVSCDDFVMIMGANGAGKSTLFDVISGKRTSDSGQVILDSQDISTLPEEKRALMIGRLCKETIERIQQQVCESCELIVHDLHDPLIAKRVQKYGVKRAPAVVVNGILSPCCKSRVRTLILQCRIYLMKIFGGLSLNNDMEISAPTRKVRKGI